MLARGNDKYNFQVGEWLLHSAARAVQEQTHILKIYSRFNDLQDDSYISILIDDGLAPSKLNELKFQVIKKNSYKNWLKLNLIDQERP